jgi:hypothetical protein
VNFVLAVMLFGTAVQAINYMILNEFVRVASNKLFKFDAPWVLTALHDGGSVWSIAAVTQFRFFQSTAAHNRFGKSVMWLTNLPFFAMFASAYWIVISVGIRVIHNDGILTSGGVFTLIAWLLIIYPLAYIALLRIPFAFNKNTQFIRWVFLTRMYRRIGL